MKKNILSFRRALLFGVAFTCTAFANVQAAPLPTDPGAALGILEKTHFDAEWAASPVGSTALGIHNADGGLDDISVKAIDAQTSRLHQEEIALSALDVSSLPQRRQDDRDILLSSIREELVSNERVQGYRHNPDTYISLATEALYSLIERDFAPASERMKDAISRELLIPNMLATGQHQLTTVPAIFLEISKEDLDGAISFVKDTIPAAFASVKDPTLQAQLRASTTETLKALRAFKTTLDHTKPQGSFALGAETFRAMLNADMVDVPMERIIAAGQAQLAKDQADFDAVSRSIDPANPQNALEKNRKDHVAADGLITLIRDQLKDAQSFVLDHKLITLPSKSLPLVTETPSFQRSLLTAATEWPGAFETKATTSFYYITPVDSKWSAKQVQTFLEDSNTPTILNITVHEAMPGHFVQGLYLRANPEWSLTRKGSQSYATTEGWAHYTEQMMVEQGFHNQDQHLHLAQLQDALLRDCRLLASFGMHTQGMSLKQATDLMVHSCHQSPMMGYKEARRGTADPGYYSYLLGKLMILHLREDLKNEQGTNFSLRSFHDALLGSGLVPVKIIRRELSGKDAPLL
ncbi:hypothetical protein AA106555_1830 [Neokomagataea thailandica NBRC 106555]|uniref:DUF885 domain-containing protein n=2 Tax=Neokomagataea TaxID=1223423 RepID=A0A4Y6V5P1_9PROT|nr:MULTISPECIES: DUF885 domain-containing protein [Neokomagataea]QDH25243.1 DUF885 domain-containing protein [Neokomagataea tanensis]GBR54809.1 hypothetical protein AA106555_1830 [Neokomagataea thailandica NBRC 106555]